MYGVEFQANVIQSVLENNDKMKCPAFHRQAHRHQRGP